MIDKVWLGGAVVVVAIVAIIAWASTRKAEGFTGIKPKVHSAILQSEVYPTSVARAERLEYTTIHGVDSVRLTVHASLFNFQDPDTESYAAILSCENQPDLELGNLKRDSSGIFKLTVREPLSTSQLPMYDTISVIHRHSGTEEVLVSGFFESK